MVPVTVAGLRYPAPPSRHTRKVLMHSALPTHRSHRQFFSNKALAHFLRSFISVCLALPGVCAALGCKCGQLLVLAQ